MDKNLLRLEERFDENGNRIMVPIPFNCQCSEAACYGKDGVWFCTSCWQALSNEDRYSVTTSREKLV